MKPPPHRSFRTGKFDFASFLFTGATGLATFLILATLAVILLNILISGWSGLSWRFITGGTQAACSTSIMRAVLPMIFGTAARVILMTIFVIPVGVITAIYLTEYAHHTSIFTRIIRGAVNNLAGVPSIVFGFFGLGFFINFIGHGVLDPLLHPGHPELIVWGKPAILWASLTWP